ncbi:unnamed protein product [Orchesella dallaii]|uniref:Cytochrome c oxidase assembly factor 6 n=1 Tax=Orchesella dallaii TaxID=48710 RepID=A0ABP1Q8B3_9HEXA
MSFPSKAEREKCWQSRDELWKCLDDNNGSQDMCTKFRELYESSCPRQWVKHFDRKREYLKFKDRIQNDGNPCHSCNIGEVVDGGGGGGRIIAFETLPASSSTSSTEGLDLEIVRNSSRSSGSHHHDDGNQSQSSSTSTTTTMKCASPNTRIFRKFQPPTFT